MERLIPRIKEIAENIYRTESTRKMLAGFLNVSMVWLLTGEGDGGPMVRGEGAKTLPAELSAVLGEIRDIRVANVKANDRLAKLEKRLREMSEQA